MHCRDWVPLSKSTASEKSSLNFRFPSSPVWVKHALLCELTKWHKYVCFLCYNYEFPQGVWQYLVLLNLSHIVGTTGFPSDSAIKNLPAMQEIQVQSLGQEDPLEESIETHFSILAWRIPRTEQIGRLQSIGSQRVGSDWRDLACMHMAQCLKHCRNLINAWKIDMMTSPSKLICTAFNSSKILF